MPQPQSQTKELCSWYCKCYCQQPHTSQQVHQNVAGVAGGPACDVKLSSSGTANTTARYQKAWHGDRLSSSGAATTTAGNHKTWHGDRIAGRGTRQQLVLQVLLQVLQPATSTKQLRRCDYYSWSSQDMAWRLLQPETTRHGIATATARNHKTWHCNRYSQKAQDMAW